MRNFLASNPLFVSLSPEAIEALSAELKTVHLGAGEVLFHQGEAGDDFYIISAGSLCVNLLQANGVETCLNDLAPGQFVGEMALLTSQPRTATVIARQDSTLLRLSRPAFDCLAETHPQLLTELAHLLQTRLQQTQIVPILNRLFGPMDDAAIAHLQSRLAWQRLDSGQVLFHQGDPGDALYIVIQGRLRFGVEEPGGLRILGEVGAGETIGEFALMAEPGTPEHLRSATVYATRLTDVAVLTRPVFEDLLCQSPQPLLQLMRRIIQRQRRVTAQAQAPAISALVVTVVPVSPNLPLADFTRQLTEAFGSLGPTLALDAQAFEEKFGRSGAAQTALDHPLSLVINAWLDERERELQYLVYAASPTLDAMGCLTPWAQRCVEDADILLLVGMAGTGASPAGVEAALTRAHSQARCDFVLLHPASTQTPSGTAAWLAPRRGGAFPVKEHHHVRHNHAPDYRRLARRVSGKALGLALAGGGARGWAHIGAIRALEEAHLEVDWVGGASMGALMTAGYALDWTVDQLSELAASFGDPKKLLDYTFPYTSITATRRITRLIQELVGDLDVEDTWRPCFCITANLTRGEEQTHLSGRLWKAMRASMAFPAIFAPVLEEGCILIDGGAANNLPVDRMRALCPTGTVIGVDLVTGSPVSQSYHFDEHTSGWQALGARLAPLRNPVRVPSLLDIVAGVVYSNNRYRLNETGHLADLLIQVPVEAYGLLEFDKHAEIIELGYRATKEQLAAYFARGSG